MIRINLLPKEKKALRRPKLKVKIKIEKPFLLVVIGSLAVLLFFVALLVWQSLQIRNLQAEVQKIAGESQALQPIISKVEKLKKDKETLQRKMNVINTLIKQQSVWPRLLDEIARRLPDNMWLTAISDKKGSLSVSGIAFSNFAISDFMSSLKHSAYFDKEKVELINIQKLTIGERTVYNFELSCGLRAITSL